MTCLSVQFGYLQYPHHARFFALVLAPKRMERQGFVSKNHRLEKADRRTNRQRRDSRY
jgi:hypothetical protein